MSVFWHESHIPPLPPWYVVLRYLFLTLLCSLYVLHFYAYIYFALFFYNFPLIFPLSPFFFRISPLVVFSLYYFYLEMQCYRTGTCHSEFGSSFTESSVAAVSKVLDPHRCSNCILRYLPYPVAYSSFSCNILYIFG